MLSVLCNNENHVIILVYAVWQTIATKNNRNKNMNVYLFLVCRGRNNVEKGDLTLTAAAEWPAVPTNISLTIHGFTL